MNKAPKKPCPESLCFKFSQVGNCFVPPNRSQRPFIPVFERYSFLPFDQCKQVFCQLPALLDRHLGYTRMPVRSLRRYYSSYVPDSEYILVAFYAVDFIRFYPVPADNRIRGDTFRKVSRDACSP